jgi:hypothetical protein
MMIAGSGFRALANNPNNRPMAMLGPRFKANCGNLKARPSICGYSLFRKGPPRLAAAQSFDAGPHLHGAMRNRWLLALLVNTCDLEPGEEERPPSAVGRRRPSNAEQLQSSPGRVTYMDLCPVRVVVEGTARDVKAICALT